MAGYDEREVGMLFQTFTYAVFFAVVVALTFFDKGSRSKICFAPGEYVLLCVWVVGSVTAIYICNCSFIRFGSILDDSQEEAFLGDWDCAAIYTFIRV